MFHHLSCATVLLGLLFSITHAVASTEPANFIQQRALGPVKLQSGLPEAASRLISSSELQLSFVRNNVFMGGQSSSDRLVLDGESSQLNLRYRRRLNDCWQVNISGVWLNHSGGLFDRPLDDWHQFFNLPDAQRDTWPANQLDYLYETGGEQRAITAETSGLGDAQLQIQRYLGCSRNSTIARFGVKLPVGAPSKFNGTGSVDAFVDVQSRWWQSRRYQRLKWAGSIGLLGTGKHHEPTKPKPLVGFGSAGINVRLNQSTQLLTQFDWHTQMFESGLRELAEPSVQLSIGLRYQTRNKGVWEFSFAEDAAVDTVPDIVVRLGWVTRFDSP